MQENSTASPQSRWAASQPRTASTAMQAALALGKQAFPVPRGGKTMRENPRARARSRQAV